MSSRTVRIDQGTGNDTLDLEVTGRGHFRPEGLNTGYYARVSITLQRITGETGIFNITALRSIVSDATGSIAVESDGTPEEPIRGSVEVAHRASKIIFPNGLTLEPVGEKLQLKHETYGLFPIDGSTIRSIKYADLEYHDSDEQLIPINGATVVHFGHSETANGGVRFSLPEFHVPITGLDTLYRFNNVSDEYDFSINTRGGGALINLKPGQQCAVLIGRESGEADAEIIVIDPPPRRLIYSRGQALPDLGGQVVYTADSVDWRSLPWPTTNGVFYRDTDGFNLGTAARPSAGAIADIAAADWDIPGSFQIRNDGTIDMNLEYNIRLETNTETTDADNPTLTGGLAEGHGISLWYSDEGTAALERILFIGLPAISGEGALVNCRLLFRGEYKKNTRFLLLHRVPSATDVNNWDHVHMETLVSYVYLEPVIRATDSGS